MCVIRTSCGQDLRPAVTKVKIVGTFPETFFACQCTRMLMSQPIFLRQLVWHNLFWGTKIGKDRSISFLSSGYFGAVSIHGGYFCPCRETVLEAGRKEAAGRGRFGAPTPNASQEWESGRRKQAGGCETDTCAGNEWKIIAVPCTRSKLMC